MISRFSNENTTHNTMGLRSIQRQEHRAQSIEDRRKARVQAVARQACYYVAGFLLSFLPTLVVRITAATLAIEASEEARLFPLLIIQAIFWPLH